MKACHERGQSVVPYGGLTNLVQGCVTTPDDLALSFEKMNQIEDVDLTGSTMTVQAGVTMQAAQERAEQENLFFPVDIGRSRDLHGWWQCRDQCRWHEGDSPRHDSRFRPRA